LFVRLLAGITLVVWLIMFHKITHNNWSWYIGR
jgi:hypothetical protein